MTNRRCKWLNFAPIGNNIRKYGVKKGMRQEDLAEKIGLSPNYLGSLERGGKNTSAFYLCWYCECIGRISGYAVMWCRGCRLSGQRFASYGKAGESIGQRPGNYIWCDWYVVEACSAVRKSIRIGIQRFRRIEIKTAVAGMRVPTTAVFCS